MSFLHNMLYKMWRCYIAGYTLRLTFPRQPQSCQIPLLLLPQIPLLLLPEEANSLPDGETLTCRTQAETMI